MGFELVIFDCDGVLVDSEPISNRIFTRALRDLGLDMTFEQVYRAFTGLSMTRCVRIVEQRRGRPVPGDFVLQLRARTRDALRAELRAVRGVETALDRIDRPLCVASSGTPEKMRFTLGLTGLLPRFEGRLFSAGEVRRGKPHPDLFLYAARSLGAQPERCAVIEDSVPGALAGTAAGMRVYGYAERTEAASLARAGAVVFDSMDDLPGLLAGDGERAAQAGGSP